jgi:predicted nucleotidyltransferase
MLRQSVRLLRERTGVELKWFVDGCRRTTQSIGGVTMEANRNLEPVLHRLRTLLPELRDRYAVDTLEVFGSRVREDASEESDLDILVTFTVTPGLFEFVRLENEIADRLGIPVDLVMRRSLKPRLRDRILAEAIPV